MCRALFAVIVLASAAACNALTGTNKYDIVDCPKGDCASGDGGANQDGASSEADGASSSDAAVDATPPCPSCTEGQACLTVITSGTSTAHVTGPSGLDLQPPQSASVCAPTGDQIRLQTSNGTVATWGGVSCKDGPVGDRCEFDFRAPGVTVTANLP